MLTPEQFADVLCDDLELPPSSFAGPISQSIRQQCEQFSTDMIPEDEEDRRVIVKVMYSLSTSKSHCLTDITVCHLPDLVILPSTIFVSPSARFCVFPCLNVEYIYHHLLSIFPFLSLPFPHS